MATRTSAPGGAIVLPDLMDNNHMVHHLAVGAGKDSNIYVVNRDNMGKFNPNNDSAIYQEIDGALPGGEWSSPAYFNNTVYYGDTGETMKAFPISNAMLATTPSSQTGNTFIYPGRLLPSPPIKPRTPLSGLSRTATLRSCMPSTLPTCRTSCTTAIRQDRAISSGRQQVHHPNHRQRQSFCGNANRSRGVWLVAVRAGRCRSCASCRLLLVQAGAKSLASENFLHRLESSLALQATSLVIITRLGDARHAGLWQLSPYHARSWVRRGVGTRTCRVESFT
jgi:hypothetical protein